MNERIRLADLPIVDPKRDWELFEALQVPAERYLNRHMERSETHDWDPSDYIPFSLGRDYEDGVRTEEGLYLPLHIKSAMIINTLTEDNLPAYYHAIALQAERDTPINNEKNPFTIWSKRWMAEEARHGAALDTWLRVTGAVHSRKMEQDRIHFLSKGETPQPKTISEMLAYTALQELATRVSHNNTRKAIKDEMDDTHKGVRHRAGEMLGKIAADESRHHNFYRDLAMEAVHIDPSTMITALGRQVVGFSMPGMDIPGFGRHALQIDRSGIYGEREFRHSVLQPTLEKIGYDNVRPEHLSKDAQKARLAIEKYVQQLDTRLARRRH